MEFVSGFTTEEIVFLISTAVVAAVVSFVVFAGFFYWFRREQRRLHKKILHAIATNESLTDDVLINGPGEAIDGELVAQFRVNHGKQVVSVIEADGRRFIHVEGVLSAPERARMVRYLKSEGFMS